MGVMSEIAMEQQERQVSSIDIAAALEKLPGRPVIQEQQEPAPPAEQPVECGTVPEPPPSAEDSIAAGAVEVLDKPDDESVAAVEARKKAEHEKAEAERKAAWEAKQAEKKAAYDARMAEVATMSSAELERASVLRIGNETERLTRRNMRVCVAEHVQTMCYEDAEFARLTLHPRKNMIHCYHYINRKAREFIEQDLKDSGEEKPSGVYGGDVPDGVVYQWAEDYFRDMDAEEDKEKDEKFEPKPYRGTTTTPRSRPKKKEEKKPAEKKNRPANRLKASFPLGRWPRWHSTRGTSGAMGMRRCQSRPITGC